MNFGDRVEVIYIAAAPRSGTTILSLLLGEVPGIFNAGEVRFLWRQLTKPGRCGCGRELRDCEVWSSTVLPTLSQDRSGGLASLTHAGKAHSFIRTLPVALVRRRVLGRLPGPMRRHLTETIPAYANLVAAGRGRVIVDSSKSPSYGYVLTTSPDVRLHLLHVVRDPRAVAYSALRARADGTSSASRTGLILYQALKWTAWNLLIELFVQRRAATYFRLVYEDFAAAPYEHLRAIVRSHGSAADVLPLAGPGCDVASLHVNHTVFGNGHRFQHGLVPIRVDDTWRHDMPWHERALVTAITWPLLVHYRSARG